MSPPARRYTDVNGFKSAFTQAVRKRLEESERSFEQLSREFYLQRFLARVFAEPGSPWVLKGGTNLLTRFPDLARHSQDIDLMCRDARAVDLDGAADELRLVGGTRPELDPFTFTVGPPTAMTGGAAGTRLSVVAGFGATELQRFPIDLVANLPLAAHLDRFRPRPVLDFAAVSDLPSFTLYPLPDQVADKVCAMYARYGSGRSVSTRYRDLVDLVIITGNQSLDASLLVVALQKEAARRGITLPRQLHPPAAQWRSGYLAEARRSTLPADLHTLGRALAAAGACLDPLLRGTTTRGTWSPVQGCWTTGSS